MNQENRIIQTNSDKEKEVEEYELVLEKQKEQNKIERFKKSGVPERFWNESFSTFYPRNSDEEKKLEAAKKYSQVKTDIVLLFTGNVGTGKTHLGSAIIREKGGSFYYSQDLVIQFMATLDFHSKVSTNDFLTEICNIETLVIDEIGRTTNMKKEQELLRLVLCRRYDKKKGSLLISNMPKRDLLIYLGTAVTDRLNETCLSFEFNGESYRAEKRNVKL